MNRKSFVLYTDYLEQLLYLDNEERGILITAVFEYVRDGKVPDFTGILGMSFTAIKSHLDRDFEKYEEVRKKRSEAGKISGQVRKEKKEQAGTCVNFVEQKQTKRTVNVNVNDSVNVNDNDNVIVSGNENENDTPTEYTSYIMPEKEKKINFAEFVTLTKKEYNTLVDKFGEEDTKRMIEILDNYKGATGKAYFSDYRVLCTWVLDRLHKDKEKERKRMGNTPYLYEDNYDHEQLEALTRKG